MKNFKKVVAGLLAVLMLALSVNVSFAAENYNAKEAEAVGKVNAAGIMTGTDKGFEPSKSLTRAEAAAIIVRMKGISKSAVDATAGTTLFTDVAASHWASGYVNQASNLGIVKGVSATTFAPDREVTIAEFTTMAVRALGAGQLVDSEGTWPTNYVNFANENGILDDVNSIYTAVSTRLNAAIIVANTLYAPMWVKSGVKSNGEIEWTKTSGDATETIIKNVLKLRETYVTPGVIKAKDHQIDSDDVVETFDLSTIKSGIKYHAFINSDNEITGLWLEDDTLEFTAISEGYNIGDNAGDNVITLKVDGKDKEYKLATKLDNVAYTPVYSENEVPSKEGALKLVSALGKDKDAFGTFTVNDKNEILTMAITKYNAYFVVDEVTKSTVKSDTKAVSGKDYKKFTSVKFNDEDDEFALVKDGKAISFADLEEGDAVRAYKVAAFDGTTGHDRFVGEVIEPVSGKVTAKGAKYIKLDGKKYDTVAKSDDANLADDIKVGDEIDAYLNNAGEVVMYKVIEEDKDNSVAIVTYLKGYSSKYNDELDNYDVKLTFMDGTTSDVLSVDYADIYDEIEDKLTIVDNKNVKVNNEPLATFEDGDALTTTNKDELKDSEKDFIGKAYADSKLGLGKVIAYELNDSKLTICIADEDEVKEDTTVKSLEVEKRSTYLADSSKNALYYITSETVIYEVEKDKTNSWKVKTINQEDLDDTTFTKVGTGEGKYPVAVVGYDKDSKEVDYVIISDEKFDRTTETNFAYIKEVSEARYNNKDAQEVTFIMLDGSEETYIYAKAEANDENLVFGKTGTDLEVGDVVDLEISGDLIMNATKPNNGDKDQLTEITSEKYVIDIVNDRLVLSTDGSAKKDYFMDDEMVVIRWKSTTDRTVKEVTDISNIKEYDSEESKFDTIQSVWTYTDDDGETTVVAITYVADLTV